MSGGRSPFQQKAGFHTVYPETWDRHFQIIPDHSWQLSLSIYPDSNNLKRAYTSLRKIFSQSVLPFKFYFPEDKAALSDDTQENGLVNWRGMECQIFVIYDPHTKEGAVGVEYLKHLMLIILKKMQEANIRLSYFIPQDHSGFRLCDEFMGPFSYPSNQDAPFKSITLEKECLDQYKIDVHKLQKHIRLSLSKQKVLSDVQSEMQKILPILGEQEFSLESIMIDVMGVLKISDKALVRKSLYDLVQNKPNFLKTMTSAFPHGVALSGKSSANEMRAEIDQVISFLRDLKENTDLSEIENFRSMFAKQYACWEERCQKVSQLFISSPDLLKLFDFDEKEMIKDNPATAEALYSQLLHASSQIKEIEEEIAKQAEQENYQPAASTAVPNFSVKQGNLYADQRVAQDYARFLSNIFCRPEDFVYYDSNNDAQYKKAQIKAREIAHLIVARSDSIEMDLAEDYYRRACMDWVQSANNLKGVLVLKEESAKQIIRKIIVESKKIKLPKEITDILSLIEQRTEKHYSYSTILEYLIGAVSLLKRVDKSRFFDRPMWSEERDFCASITCVTSRLKLNVLNNFRSITLRQVKQCIDQSVDSKEPYVGKLKTLLFDINDENLYLRGSRLFQLQNILFDYYAQLRNKDGYYRKDVNTVACNIIKILSQNIENMAKSKNEFYLQHPDYPALKHFVVERHLLRAVGMATSGCAKSMCVIGAAYLLGEMNIHGCVTPLPGKMNEGIEWLKKSSEHKYANAAYLLASFYANMLVELENKSPDAKNAAKYLKIAANLGHPLAQKLLNINEDFKWGSVMIIASASPRTARPSL